MTQEQKELLKDLCARLPYRVKVQIKDVGKIYEICTLEEIDCSDEEMSVAVKHENGEMAGYDFDLAKPYLFPLSSMTKEQKEEFNSYFASVPYYGDNIHIPYYFVESLINFYNKHHLDWRGLIPKGLANDATGLNIY